MRRDNRPEPGPLINERLAYKIRDLRIIGPDGAQVGIMQSRQALAMAKEAGLDLVLVSPTATPPVARIVDYGRMKYEEKKLKKNKTGKQQETKGINISPRIAEHDIAHLIKNAIKFLEEGNKVRVVCKFRAREVTHPEIGRKKLDIFAEKVAHVATVEKTPSLEGKQMAMILLPKPQAVQKKKDAKAENTQDSGQEVQDNGIGEDNAPEVAQ